MPKIPTFITEARPTAEVSSIKSNIQIPLSQTLGTALAPITRAITEHAVQEKNLENKAEALSLENNSIMKLNDVIERASRLDNKDEAYNLIQTESKVIQEEFANQASNKFVKASFNNSFLGEVQKGIFKTNTRVSKNILDTLDNQVYLKKNRLLTEAYVSKDPLALSLVQTDLEKLYEDSYKGRIDTDEYNKLIQGIPGEMEVFEVSQLISSDPRKAFLDLQSKDKFKNLNLNKRIQLENQARLVLTPQIRQQWNNVLAASAAAKEIPFFDMELAKKILPKIEVNKMLQKKYIIDNTVDNKKILFSAPNKDLEGLLKTFSKEATILAGEKDGELIIKEYQAALVTRSTALNSDPVKFINDTNPEIENLNIQLDNETNADVQATLKSQLTEELINVQTKLGVPEHKQKVMTVRETTNFVETYKLKSQDNSAESKAMLASLQTHFGEFDSKALQELQSAGLPFTAVFAITLANDIEAEKFFSFDNKIEQDKLKDWGTKNDIKFSDIEAEIATNSDLQEFENIIRRNNNIDSSQAISLMDNMQSVMAYYALNEMYTNSKFDQADAVESAANMFLKNFQIEETYFIPLKYDGKDLTEFGTTAGAVKDKAELIKDYYLEDFNAVAFKSTDPFNQGVSEQELSEKHKRMMRIHGEWRNKGDGSGLVFGVVLDGGQFAPVVNINGKELSFNFNDTTYDLPNTDIQMDIKKLRISDVPSEEEIAALRGYSGFSINENDLIVKQTK